MTENTETATVDEAVAAQRVVGEEPSGVAIELDVRRMAQLPRRRLTRPTEAPRKSRMQALDWMKKPGNRFSTARL